MLIRGVFFEVSHAQSRPNPQSCLTLCTEELKSTLKKTKNEEQEITKNYNNILDKENKQRDSFKSKNIGLYHYKWELNLLKWKHTKNFVFFDFGEENVYFFKNETNKK